jgi:hypothetical protein
MHDYTLFEESQFYIQWVKARAKGLEVYNSQSASMLLFEKAP